jgi:hypothetical protein
MTIDRAVEVLPMAVHPKMHLVDVRATANVALSASTQLLRESRLTIFPVLP